MVRLELTLQVSVKLPKVMKELVNLVLCTQRDIFADWDCLSVPHTRALETMVYLTHL